MARRLALAALLPALGLGCGGGGGGAEPGPAPSCTQPARTGPVVNVKDYGARGDGAADDTAAIQRAIHAVAGQDGTVRVPAGTYLVDPVAAVRVGSRMTLALDAAAVLQAIPTGADFHNVVMVADAEDVAVTGGTLRGDKGRHLGGAGAGGAGLSIYRSSNVWVVGVTAREVSGDGFYVNLCNVSDPATGAVRGAYGNVVLCAVAALGNRRNGLSLISGTNVLVSGSTFSGSGGAVPEDGIDLEPNPYDNLCQVVITGCTVEDNAGDGIEDGLPLASPPFTRLTGVTLSGNRVSGNGFNTLSSLPRNGIEVSHVQGHSVTGNTVTGTNGIGIFLRDGASGISVTGNEVSGNAKCGICDGGVGDTVGGNTETGNGVCQ